MRGVGHGKKVASGFIWVFVFSAKMFDCGTEKKGHGAGVDDRVAKIFVLC